MNRRRCRGLHQTLLVEDFTEMGATVSCIQCESTFHLDLSSLDNHYVGFEHVSTDGPEEDKVIYILNSVIYGKKAEDGKL